MNPARVPVVLKRNNAERAERPSKKQAVIDSAERPVQESPVLNGLYIALKMENKPSSTNDRTWPISYAPRTKGSQIAGTRLQV